MTHEYIDGLYWMRDSKSETLPQIARGLSQESTLIKTSPAQVFDRNQIEAAYSAFVTDENINLELGWLTDAQQATLKYIVNVALRTQPNLATENTIRVLNPGEIPNEDCMLAAFRDWAVYRIGSQIVIKQFVF